MILNVNVRSSMENERKIEAKLPIFNLMKIINFFFVSGTGRLHKCGADIFSSSNSSSSSDDGPANTKILWNRMATDNK